MGTVSQTSCDAHRQAVNVFFEPSENLCVTWPITGPRASIAVNSPGAISPITALALVLEPSVRTISTFAGPGLAFPGTMKLIKDHPAPVFNSGAGCATPRESVTR